MKTIQELQIFLRKGYLDYRQNLVVDCAIFGYHNGELKLLLVKNKIITKWCLPGGYVCKEENLNQAAARLTAECTGIENLFLKQFKTFGEPGRNNPAAVDLAKLTELTGVKMTEPKWLMGETISVGFYAITDIVNAQPEADFLSSECCWFSIDKLPEFAFDHAEMAHEALATMRMNLYHYPIGINLLPPKFTLKEIKLFYEVMSGKTLHITNFPNKLISLGLIVKTDEKKSIGAHRSPVYYKFDETAYEKALKEGLVLV